MKLQNEADVQEESERLGVSVLHPIAAACSQSNPQCMLGRRWRQQGQCIYSLPKSSLLF